MLSRIAESLYWIGRYVKIAVGRDHADVAPVRGTYQGSGETSLEVAVRSLTIDEARDLITSRGGPGPRRGELIQYQRLGAAAYARLRGAIARPVALPAAGQVQRLGGMVQRQPLEPDDEAPSGANWSLDRPDVPRQQPQQ